MENQLPQSYTAVPFHHLLQQQQQQQQQQQLQIFWSHQRQEIDHVTDFKNHQLPLARIKKIMKADEDVRMISAEAPILFAKACELFVLELTIRSWLHAEENKRRTLQKNDIAAAITRTDIFDFLVDIVPREEAKEDAAGGASAAGAGVPYYFPAGMGQVDPGAIIGSPAIEPAYMPQQQSAWQHAWDHSGGFSAEESCGEHSVDGHAYVEREKAVNSHPLSSLLEGDDGL